jgi:hypothetical protein
MQNLHRVGYCDHKRMLGPTTRSDHSHPYLHGSLNPCNLQMRTNVAKGKMLQGATIFQHFFVTAKS